MYGKRVRGCFFVILHVIYAIQSFFYRVNDRIDKNQKIRSEKNMAKTTMTREEFQKQISDSVKAKNSNSKEFMNVVNAISMINNLGERTVCFC